MSSRTKEIKEMIDVAVAAGWRMEQSRGTGHIKLFPADKMMPPVGTSLCPTDSRAVKNFRAHLRRSGLDI